MTSIKPRAPERSPLDHAKTVPEAKASPVVPASPATPPAPPEFSINHYVYHEPDRSGRGGHAVVQYVPLGGSRAAPIPVENIPPHRLADWDQPFTVQVNLGHENALGTVTTQTTFSPPAHPGVRIGEGPGFGFKDGVELPPVPVGHTPAQVRDYAELQRHFQPGEGAKPALTPEKAVNGMLVADFMEDAATLHAGKAWLLDNANPAALESLGPFLHGLDAVKVPNSFAARDFSRAYLTAFPMAAPAPAREAADLAASLLINLRESPDMLGKNPWRLSRLVNEESLARLERNRPGDRPSYPPAQTIAASHDRLRTAHPSAPPDLLLAASIHHAHVATTLPGPALLAEQDAIHQGLRDLRPDRALNFKASHERLQTVSREFAAPTHALEYELRGLPDELARAAKPQRPYSMGGGLTEAALHGDMDTARLLLGKGIRMKGPAVVSAAWKGDVPMMELLMREGTLQPSQLQAAWRAVESHGDAGVARFLLERGALDAAQPPRGSSEHRSPWELSFLKMAEKGHTEVADMLLNANVGPLVRGEGFKAAAKGGSSGVVGLLLGESTEAQRDAAVFMAAAHGHTDTAKLIHAEGISEHARVQTLALAERKRDAELVALLKE